MLLVFCRMLLLPTCVQANGDWCSVDAAGSGFADVVLAVAQL